GSGSPRSIEPVAVFETHEQATICVEYGGGAESWAVVLIFGTLRATRERDEQIATDVLNSEGNEVFLQSWIAERPLCSVHRIEVAVEDLDATRLEIRRV